MYDINIRCSRWESDLKTSQYQTNLHSMLFHFCRLENPVNVTDR